MDYLHRVLLKNNDPDWMIKESGKKPVTPIINPDTGLEVKKNIFTSVHYIPGSSEEFRRIFQHTGAQVIFKEANTLKSINMHPKDKIPSQLKIQSTNDPAQKKIATFLTLENPADVWKIE